MKKFLSFTAGAAILAGSITAQAGGIDVVIGIDESGSMSSAINNVKTNVGTIYDALPAGSHVGLVGYGTSSHCGGGSQVPHIHTSITTDRNVFYDSVDDMIASGGREEGYRLVYEIATDTIADGWDSSSNQCNANQSLGFTGTQHCQIVITDERLDQGGRTQQEAIKALQDNGGIFFGILKSRYASEGQPLAAAVTGGKIFDFDAFINDPTNVINEVLTACMEAIDPLNLAADDGLDPDAGECIPANSTDISYTVSYENTNPDGIAGVEINHTDGTWGGTSWFWNIGDVAAGASDNNLVTLPLGTLTPGATFVNQFTLTSTTPDVPETTVVEKTLVCPNTPPEARCKDVTLYLDSNGRAVLNPPQANNGSSDPDSDPITFSLSKNNFNCSDIGTQHAVTLTVTDDGGLSDSCVSKVTVVDNLSPVPNAASLPQVTGQCSATIPAAPTATDNCAGTVTGTTGDPLSYSTQGTYTVTWTFDDGKGNTSSQTQQVVVQDTVAPTVITKNITVPLNANGNASISVDDIDNGSTDNCCLGSKSISKSSFTCADVGENTVTLTVTDCNGNSNSAPATVTVVDNIAPVVLTQDVVVYLEDCNASITADDINAGSSDACGIASLSVDQDSFTCSDIGENTVTLTVTDNNGNSSTGTATVTIPNRPPHVDTAYPSTDCFSMPPDHRMEEISIEGVTDPDGQPVNLEITSITSDEPILSGGCADAYIGENGIAELRVERYGINGRVYMVNFTASDGQAESDGNVKIVVPYGPLPRYTCEGVVDNGQNYDAADEASCPIVRPRLRFRR